MSFAAMLAPLTPTQLALPASGGNGGAAAAIGNAAGDAATGNFARALDAAGAAPTAGAGTPADGAGTAAGPRPGAVEPTLRPAVPPGVHEAAAATAADPATAPSPARPGNPAADAAAPPSPRDTMPIPHAPPQATARQAGANRRGQPAAAVAVAKDPPAARSNPLAALDGEGAKGPAAEAPAGATGDDSAPGAAAAGTDAATLLAELRARHPPRNATPVPSASASAPAPAPRDGDTPAAAAPRLTRRTPALPPASSPSPSLARDSLVVLPPRLPSTGAIDAQPLAGGVPGVEIVPPPAPALAGPLQPALLQPGLQAAPAAASVAVAHLPAAPGSAEFTTQLGAQLTTFIRDGVQHARLHLNPAEMGPVTVQIQLDGPSAQVHLAAEHGLTRQALEQSMPLLAGSLREAGLTLSGGGVFEQPRPPREGAPGTPAGSRRGDDIGAEPAAHPAAAAVRRRGVVDLVA